jgi:tRNA nucleotidyltransferase (CCA-adding enzyme)
VLHNLSFVEDPTRVFRAIRFEQRLGFHIATHTENLIKNAVKLNLLHSLGGKRLLTELVLILKEKEPIKAVQRMSSLGLLPFIHARLQLTEHLQHLFREAQEIMVWYSLLFLDRTCEQWLVYYLILCYDLDDTEFSEVCLRLVVNGDRLKTYLAQRNAVRQCDIEFKRRSHHLSELRPSELYHALSGLSDAFLLYLMATTQQVSLRRGISHYFTHLQNVHCLTSGDDLKQLGIRPGPRYAEILTTLLDARLNGEVQSKEDELQLVRGMM